MQAKQNTYICLYKNKRIEVQSDTTYHAQLEAAKQLNVKHSYLITVMLAMKNDQEVVHIAIN